MIEITKLYKIAEEFINKNPLNFDKELNGMPIYEPPIFGVASAFDPLFEKLREPEVVGPHYLSPQEWLPEANTVISYFLPYSSQVREANRSEGYPAVEWLHGRFEGEFCNNGLRELLCTELKMAGAEAVAPSLDPRFKRVGYNSNWSERHAAFIAGLGTFGLSKALITEKGCAGRYGSVITSIRFEPTPRKYQDVYEYCNKCGSCISRCPADAITMKGKEHDPCHHFVHVEVEQKHAPRYGCGKCQTAVPCEYSRPVK